MTVKYTAVEEIYQDVVELKKDMNIVGKQKKKSRMPDKN